MTNPKNIPTKRFSHVSIRIGLGGVRVRADGDTGWAAWQALGREHPRVAQAVALYLAAVVVLISAVCTAVLSRGL
ncbi:hypothetical protein [Streptomyces sp. NPDC007346]|uniref:hypothetical protein n=1 Tax=Streptomyces sp. NPDC007346 TaxID=3154682 RepID=UPI0034537A4F